MTAVATVATRAEGADEEVPAVKRARLASATKVLTVGSGSTTSPVHGGGGTSTLKAEDQQWQDEELHDTAAALAAHSLLLAECHWYVALSELRKRFCKSWKATWARPAAAEAFNAWLFEALSLDEEGNAWPPSLSSDAADDGVEDEEREMEAEEGCRGKSAVEAAVAASGEESAMPSCAVEAWALLAVPRDWPLDSNAAAALETLRKMLEELRDGPSTHRAWKSVPAEELEKAIKPLDLEARTDPSEIRALARVALRPLLAAAVRKSAVSFTGEAAALMREVRARWGRCCVARARAAAGSVSREEMRRAGSCLAAVAEAIPAGGGSGAEAKVRFELKGPLPPELEGKMPRGYEIYARHAEKLRQRFDLHRREAGGDHAPFEARCWTLLTRYQALYGPHDEGVGWHMALTQHVLDSLAQGLEVSHELFASPLNCTLPSYCSAFKDTDACFGSVGSFFPFCRGRLAVQGGSYECNPPFEEHFMRRVVKALHGALEHCGRPLSVVLVLPDWPESEAAAAASSEPHCRARLQIAGESHEYLHGRQHCCQQRHRLVRQAQGRGSLVVFLQNEAGAAQWPVTHEVLERHRQAWGRGS